MAVTQTTESAASRLARKLPPDPNAGSAARRLAAKLPPAPAQTNAIPEDGSGFVGEAAKGSAKAALNIAAGAASSGPSVIQYLGEAVAGANALPMQILSAGANAIGMPMLGDAYQRTAEAVASKGIDISRAVGRGVANTPIMPAGGLTLPQMAQAPRALAQSKTLAPSDRAAADLAQMNNGTNFLPQTSAGWGSLTGEQAPSLLLGLGTGVVGGPGVGVTVTGLAAGAQEYESTLAQLRQEFPGKSADFYEGEAARRAIQSAAVESATEGLPFGEILEGKLAKMFVNRKLSQWPKWARALMGQIAKGVTSAPSESVEEVTSEGATSVGDWMAGDPNAFDNLPRRMATSGLIGGAMGAGMGVAIPGGFGNLPPQTPPTDRMGGRGPTQTRTPQAPDNQAAPPDNRGQAPDNTALDEAAAMAEARLNERYNRAAPVGGPSPSPVLPGAQPPASSGPTALQTGPVVGGATSASPQSTREPWQMTRVEWVGGGTVGRIRFGDVDREVVDSPHFDTPEEAKAWAASRGIVNPQIQSSGKRGGPKLYKASGSASFHRDAVEAAHAAGKTVPPEVLAEYGIKPEAPREPYCDVSAAFFNTSKLSMSAG